MSLSKHIFYSMTGYGRGIAQNENFRVQVELRTVNGRFLEARLKLPRNAFFFEPLIREKIQTSLKRGVVDASLTIHSAATAADSSLDMKLAEVYAQGARRLARDLGIENGLTAAALLKCPGVINADESSRPLEEKELRPLLEQALDAALGELLSMRAKEGQKLAAALARELETVRAEKDAVSRERAMINKLYFDKMNKRLQDFLGKAKAKIDEARMQQEIAFYIDRSDVTEEIDRLGSHVRQVSDLLAGKGERPFGKRLDFLVQEMGREANTIGAKSDDAGITRRVLEMKLALERMREQSQNLE